MLFSSYITILHLSNWLLSTACSLGLVNLFVCLAQEIDVKAGGGFVIYMGDMVRDFLMKLDWFGALFPRIPVPIQKVIVANMKEYGPSIKEQYQEEAARAEMEK